MSVTINTAPVVAMDFGAILMAATQRPLTEAEKSFLEAAMAAKQTRAAAVLDVPAYGSLDAIQAAALKPRVREAYLASAGTGFGLNLPPIGADKVESVAVAIARKLGASVTITDLRDGRGVMLVTAEHGKADGAGEGGAPRAKGDPTPLQRAIIEACSRQDEHGNTIGATSAELHAATGQTDPQSWSQRAQGCQGFGYKYWVSTNVAGKRVYHLDPVADGDETPESTGEGQGEGEGEGETQGEGQGETQGEAPAEAPKRGRGRRSEG